MGARRTIFRTLVCVAIAHHGAAHSCDSGQRVTCMEVQSTGNAPSTNGESYDARGYPLCTPSGERVFCLVDHDYHTCSAGQVPCCPDGSNPRHGRHKAAFDGAEDVICTPHATTGAPTAPPTAVATAPPTVPSTTASQTSPPEAASSLPVQPHAKSEFQVILDDSMVAPHEMANAFAGSYQPCMMDAYQGQFHHDWARNKGSATFSYKFDPPKSGCYFIEEYHPGSTESCARYLPNNALLDVDYSSDGNKQIYIDQGSNGAQWNPVGKLMFVKGRKVSLTMRNHDAEQCREPPCFWVADAFRLTWMEDQCSPDLKLTMQVRLDHDDTKDSVLLKMKEHKSVLQATVETHFGYDAVEVLDIVVIGRRLGEDHGLVKVAVSLLVFGAPHVTSADLNQALQRELSDAGAGLQIKSAEIDRTPEDSPTAAPTAAPTAVPTAAPTSAPTAPPTAAATAPTAEPKATPTAAPTAPPTAPPTAAATAAPTAAPTAVPTAAPTSAPTAPPTAAATAPTDVKLMMQVRLGHDDTKVSALVKMKKHKSVLKATLESHFGYDAVEVLDIIAVGRRLGEGHGLVKMEASLLVFGAPRATNADLSQALQRGLSDAGADLQIESATIEWTPEGSPAAGDRQVDRNERSKFLPIILICGGVAALLTTIACVVLIVRCRQKRASSQKVLSPVGPEYVKQIQGNTAKTSEENPNVAVPKGDQINDVKDIKDESEIESVSTATPTFSEQVSSQACTSIGTDPNDDSSSAMAL